MGRTWLGIIIGVALFLAGSAFAWFLMQRADSSGSQVVAAELSTLPPATATSSVPPTATRKPQPAVVQATRLLPSPQATATQLPVATAVPTLVPTTFPTDEPEPLPTATTLPTSIPQTPPTPTIEAAGTDWLQYVNIFRSQASLPPLLENTTWSLDSSLHSRYMTYTGNLSHNEDPASQYYTKGGQAAGENGNIAAGWVGSDPFKWAINYWMSAPFHAIPIIDPQLYSTGFAEYRDVAGAQPLTATMDVRRGLGAMPEGVTFPIMYPRDGGLTWVLRYSLPEFPEALSTCAGYVQPTGAPIILQLGDGRGVPNVTATALYRDGEYLAHCRFDETNFTHPNEWRQKSARLILDNRDAIVIIPQQPLLPNSTYSVRVDANGQTYTWSFHTLAGPP